MEKRLKAKRLAIKVLVDKSRKQKAAMEQRLKAKRLEIKVLKNKDKEEFNYSKKNLIKLCC